MMVVRKGDRVMIKGASYGEKGIGSGEMGVRWWCLRIRGQRQGGKRVL